MTYKMRVIPLITVSLGHYEGPMIKRVVHIKMVPTEGIIRK